MPADSSPDPPSSPASTPPALEILVDADACPVKDEIYRVARRTGLSVKVVANQWMRTPSETTIELVQVDGGFDAADDWIAERASARSIVVTADIPLAARCLEAGARVLGHRGREFTEDSIGDALATRELLADLRATGEVSGGPAPFAKKDRSAFLQGLDRLVVAMGWRP